jgi:hypothetical protein
VKLHTCFIDWICSLNDETKTVFNVLLPTSNQVQQTLLAKINPMVSISCICSLVDLVVNVFIKEINNCGRGWILQSIL